MSRSDRWREAGLKACATALAYVAMLLSTAAAAQTQPAADPVTQLEQAVAKNPDDAKVHLALGVAYLERSDMAQAVAALRKAVALEPRNIAAHFNLGLALRETGDLDAALHHLRLVVRADDGDASRHYELGQTLRQSGQLSEAIAAFERAVAIDPEMREGYYALGAALKQQSATARATAPPASSPGDEAVSRAKAAAARSDLKAAGDALAEALQRDPHHAEAHTLQGFVLGQQGSLPAALPHLQRAATLRPESSEIRHNLGAALWYSGAREKAIAELRASVRLDPGSAGGHAFLGMALLETGDLPGARASLQLAMALSPAMAAVYVDLGVVFLREGKLEQGLGQLEAGLNVPAPVPPTPSWDAAIAALRQALALNPQHQAAPESHNVLGLMLGRKGAPGDEVVAAFRAAIKMRPDYPEAHNNLGLVLIQSGKDDEGIAALREAVRLAPAYAEARTNLGAALTPTDVETAIKELEEAVRLAPGSVKALFNLAVAYAASPAHGPGKGIEALEKVIELAPDFPRAHLALGKALLQDGKVTEAVSALQNAVKLEPDGGEANYQLGLALVRAGRKEDGAAQLKKGRELVVAGDRAQNAALDVTDGRAALDRGDLEEAVSKFRRAAELQPQSPEPKRLLAVALERLEKLKVRPAEAAAPMAVASGSGVSEADDLARVSELEGYIREAKWAEVEPLLTNYVAERPKSSWGWYALGYSYFAQKKIGESIKALARSLQIDIKNVEAHKILGRNLMIIGRFDAAQLEFEQAIRYKPDSAEAHYNLGKLHSIQDNWEPARKALEEAVRLDPAYVEAVDALGFALEALGDDPGAVAMYRRALALNEERKGTFAAPHVNLSAYYNRAGNPEQAIEHARKALELDPRSDRALFQKGRAAELLGNLDEAADALNEAITLNPRASSYYYVMANICRRLGLKEESRNALEMYKKLERESNELERKRKALESAELPKPPGSGRE
jgi:tetratricopeptide (TPR) repeat protein